MLFIVNSFCGFCLYSSFASFSQIECPSVDSIFLNILSLSDIRIFLLVLLFVKLTNMPRDFKILILPFPIVAPVESCRPSMRHDRGLLSKPLVSTSKPKCFSAFIFFSAYSPIKSPSTSQGPRWPWNLIALFKGIDMFKPEFRNPNDEINPKS